MAVPRVGCTTAYADMPSRLAACHIGCLEMMRLQNSAPYLNGWLVYMGASDKNVVLLQRELELASNEWVALDTVMEEFKLDDNNSLKAMAFYPARINSGIVNDQQQQRLTINYCLPTWMWMVPVLLFMLFVWLQYGRQLNHWLVVNAEHQTGGDAMAPVAILVDIEHAPKTGDFTVSSDSYFYPMPAVPPPKYNESVEAMLSASFSSEREAEKVDLVNPNKSIKI